MILVNLVALLQTLIVGLDDFIYECKMEKNVFASKFFQKVA